MLKQGVKTINAEFIRTHALSQLSFVQFRPYATLFPEPLLILMLKWKSRKTLGTSLDLTLSFKTSVAVRVEVLFQIWIIWKIGVIILFKTNMAEKDVCRANTFHSLDCNYFCTDVLHRWWLLKEKQEQIRLSPCSLNSFYYFFIFRFKGLSFKAQFKIEFWPPVNGGQLVLE